LAAEKAEALKFLTRWKAALASIDDDQIGKPMVVGFD
jgi:hypothetical protein